MKEFPIVPTNKQSIANRKLIHGVGINDADYMVSPTINGEKLYCPLYKRWSSMISRCYSAKCQKKQPTYLGCSIFPEWIRFSNFRSWMIKQDWKGKELDKDIVKTGNKIYSPDTCIFVTQEINRLLIDHRAARGDQPQGVHLRKDYNRFHSSCNINGKRRHLGFFKTPEEASRVYKAFKSSHVESIANQQSEPLKSYLIRIASEIRSSD